MTCMDYKGTGNIQSFRGLLADGEQEKIRIQGSVGAVAWRVIKFQVISPSPVNASSEHVCKIYREEQSSVTPEINFADNELLGVAVWTTNGTAQNYPEDLTVIFDNALFVRNLYVTQSEQSGAASLNYYIELEEVKVSKASMAQLAVAAARRDTSLA